MKVWERVNWPALAGLIWGGLVLGIAIHGYIWPEQHSVYTTAYAPAVRRWWAGEDLYEDAGPVKGYRYGPPFIVLLAPFAMLPDHWGNAAWKIFACAFYALALGLAGKRLLPHPLSHNQLAALFLLAALQSLESMHNGQANLIMLGAMLLGLAAAADGCWNLAALGLAAATLIKGYPLALGLVVAVLYPARFALRYLAALGLGLALPCVLGTPRLAADQTISWINHLAASTAVTRGEVSRSFDSLFDAYGQGMGGHTFVLLELLAGAAVLGLSIWQARRTTDRHVLLTHVFVLFAVWVVLFGPATESCTYVIAAPAIAWALVDSFDRGAWWGTRLLLGGSLLLMGPLVTDLPGQTVRSIAVRHGSQPVGALLFLACVLSNLGGSAALRPCRRRAGSSGPPTEEREAIVPNATVLVFQVGSASHGPKLIEGPRSPLKIPPCSTSPSTAK